MGEWFQLAWLHFRSPTGHLLLHLLSFCLLTAVLHLFPTAPYMFPTLP